MSLSQEKLDKEILAQKKRVLALSHLEKQGQSVKSRGNTVEAKPAQRDNTLDLIFQQNITTLGQQSGKDDANKAAILKQQEELRRARERNNVLKLAANWTQVKDEQSGRQYYWNTKTNETSWEAPVVASIPEDNDTQKLPVGWEEKKHAATQQVYYVHSSSGKKSWTFPTNSTALANDEKQSGDKRKSAVGSETLSSQKVTKTGDRNSSTSSTSNKKKGNDMMDYWSGLMEGGKESKGGKEKDKMADSTASGPLWQQRPYPAPGSILKKDQQPAGGAVGPSGPPAKC